MTAILKSMVCAALYAATLTVDMRPANAVPANGFAQVADQGKQSPELLTQVQYRPRYETRRYSGYQGNRYRRNGGRNIALGIGAVIIGGIVLSEAARSEHRQTYASDWQRCADTYRSFERSTGMYTGYDGERHTCPYLN